MRPSKHLVQLFNACRQERVAERPEADVPRHQRSESVLADAGFAIETIPAYGWPWNPAARMHNAYLGLDPLRALHVLLRRRDAAVVCAHMESALLILLLRRVLRFRPPVVIWEVPWSAGWRYRALVSRLAIPRADCSVVFGSSQIGLLRSTYGTAAKAAFIPFCVDTAFFRPMPGPAGTERYILSCGLDSGRDFGTVLQAVAGVPAPVTIKAGSLTVDPATHPTVTLLTGRLSFAAYRAMYAGASMVLVTTHATQNASGVTSLMEAMAMGKPVIVSDNPALRDYLPPPGAGVVVPVGDAGALRAAILDLLHDPAKAAAMGRAARAYAERRFTPEQHFQAVADLLRRVIRAAS